MYDFIIIGGGLAGVTFANFLEKHGKSFCLIADRSQVASLIAGGVYNPVVLKRFTPIWRAEEVMSMIEPFYTEIEAKTGVSFHISMPVLRKFASVEEQNNWFTAADQPLLSGYLSTALVPETNPAVPAPFLFGEVMRTGRVEVKKYLLECLRLWQNRRIGWQCRPVARRSDSD